MYSDAIIHNTVEMDFAGYPGKSDPIPEKQKPASDELKSTEFADSLPQIIFETDAQGRLNFLNLSAFHTFGYSRNEFDQGLTIFDLVVPEEHEKLGRHLERSLHEPSAGEAEFMAITGHGRIFPVLIDAVSVMSTDGASGYRGIIVDISRRKKMEQEALKAMKLESIGILAGGIAHEFNNRLMSIQGNVSLMLLDIDSDDPHYEKLKKIEHYIQKGAEFTRRLISFSRGGKFHPEPADINEIVRSTSGMFGLTRKRIRIRLDLQEKLWQVEADPAQIELALMNLYINASQAMEDDGELDLETENVIVDEQDVKPYDVSGGRYVRVRVRDNGPGIDHDIREKIFDPFFTTQGIGKGTGLGLSSVYGIVRHHGGFITVFSEVKKGTSFDLFLPASDVKAVENSSGTSASPCRQQTILFVDDEPMIVDVTSQLLQRRGYRMLTAENGREGIEVFSREKDSVDLVIMDMVMPVMGGRDAYIGLKALKPDVKVLLSSGYSLDGEAEEILGMGCNGFIQKPYMIDDLIEKINEVLDEPQGRFE